MKTLGSLRPEWSARILPGTTTRSREPRRARSIRWSLLTCLLLAACSDDDPFGSESCPSPTATPGIEQRICEIFPAGASRDEALRRVGDIRDASPADERLEGVLRLVDFIGEQEERLLDPDGQGPRTALEAQADLLEAVLGLAEIRTDVAPVALTEGLAAAVFPQGGTFIAKDECFGLEFPPDWGGPAFLLITPLPRTSDPLNESQGQFVEQFPAYADITLSAQPQKSVEVGIFTITNDVDPARIPALRIAHNVVGGGVEIGPLVDLSFELPCPAGAALSVRGPDLARDGRNGIALAAGRTTGSTASSFSPFGTVDPGD